MTPPKEFPVPADLRCLRKSQILSQVLPISPSTFYRMIKAKRISDGIRLSARIRVWSVQEIYAVARALPQRKESDALRP